MAAPDPAPEPAPRAGRDGGDDRATSEVVRSLVANTQELVKKEIELAKLELKDILIARLVAIVAVAVAGVLGLVILAFAGVTVAAALQEAFAPWLAWLIVTALYVLVAVILLAVAYRKATRPPNRLARTREEARQTLEWAKLRAGRFGDREVSP